MSDAAAGPRRESQNGEIGDDPLGIRQWLTSLVLVSTTIIVGIFCIIVLSSTLTQTRLAGISIDGVSLSIWKLDYIQREWAAMRTQLRDQTLRLQETEKSRNSLSAKLALAETAYTVKKHETLNLLEEFYHRASIIEPELTGLIHNQSAAEQYGRIIGAQGRLREEHPELAPLIEQIIKTYTAFRAAEAERGASEGGSKVIQKEIDTLKTERAANEKSLDDVFDKVKDGLSKNAEMRSRVENTFYELQPGELDGSSTIRFSNLLITTRPDMLALWLVILMGVLGSSLQMTNSFFKDRDRKITLGAYFLHLSVGAITALAIFIVAKAGVPVIADASRLGGDAAINPYFVSFLAIVSGLLSENALASIEAQGKRLFGEASPETHRWARVDLTTDATKEGRSVRELADYIGENEIITSAMLKGDERIEPSKQHVISVYLRRPLREIFTDIAPTAAAEKAEPQKPEGGG
jgi:hypothetical protein